VHTQLSISTCLLTGYATQQTSDLQQLSLISIKFQISRLVVHYGGYWVAVAPLVTV